MSSSSTIKLEAPDWWNDLPADIQQMLVELGWGNKDWLSNPDYVGAAPDWVQQERLMGYFGFASLGGLAPLYVGGMFTRAFTAGQLEPFGLDPGAYGYAAREQAAFQTAYNNELWATRAGLKGRYFESQANLWQARGAYYGFQQNWTPTAEAWSAIRLGSYFSPELWTIRALGFPFYSAGQQLGAGAAMAPYVRAAYAADPTNTMSKILSSPTFWAGQYPDTLSTLFSGLVEWTGLQSALWILGGSRSLGKMFGVGFLQAGLGIAMAPLATYEVRGMWGVPAFANLGEFQSFVAQEAIGWTLTGVGLEMSLGFGAFASRELSALTSAMTALTRLNAAEGAPTWMTGVDVGREWYAGKLPRLGPSFTDIATRLALGIVGWYVGGYAGGELGQRIIGEQFGYPAFGRVAGTAIGELGGAWAAMRFGPKLLPAIGEAVYSKLLENVPLSFLEGVAGRLSTVATRLDPLVGLVPFAEAAGYGLVGAEVLFQAENVLYEISSEFRAAVTAPRPKPAWSLPETVSRFLFGYQGSLFGTVGSGEPSWGRGPPAYLPRPSAAQALMVAHSVIGQAYGAAIDAMQAYWAMSGVSSLTQSATSAWDVAYSQYQSGQMSREEWNQYRAGYYGARFQQAALGALYRATPYAPGQLEYSQMSSLRYNLIGAPGPVMELTTGGYLGQQDPAQPLNWRTAAWKYSTGTPSPSAFGGGIPDVEMSWAEYAGIRMSTFPRRPFPVGTWSSGAVLEPDAASALAPGVSPIGLIAGQAAIINADLPWYWSGQLTQAAFIQNLHAVGLQTQINPTTGQVEVWVNGKWMPLGGRGISTDVSFLAGFGGRPYGAGSGWMGKPTGWQSWDYAEKVAWIVAHPGQTTPLDMPQQTSPNVPDNPIMASGGFWWTKAADRRKKKATEEYQAQAYRSSKESPSDVPSWEKLTRPVTLYQTTPPRERDDSGRIEMVTRRVIRELTDNQVLLSGDAGRWSPFQSEEIVNQLSTPLAKRILDDVSRH